MIAILVTGRERFRANTVVGLKLPYAKKKPQQAPAPPEKAGLEISFVEFGPKRRTPHPHIYYIGIVRRGDIVPAWSTLTTPSSPSFGNPEFSGVPGMSDAVPLAAPTATGRAVVTPDKPLLLDPAGVLLLVAATRR